MNTIIILIVIAVVWQLKGHIEQKKRAEYLLQRDAVKNGALIVLKQLRKIKDEPYSQPITIKIDNDHWNNLVDAQTDKEVLREIGTTRAEIIDLHNVMALKHSWFNLMQDINRINHSKSMFEYYLKERTKLLAENNMTLADFGVMQDDTDELWKGFRSRFAKHIRMKALGEVDQIREELLKLGSVLQFDDEDFGLSEVVRRLDKLQYV